MKIGYARVSTEEQNLNLQLDALSKEGCDKIFQDTASGAKEDREGLLEALNHLRPGDTLIVWKLDRLGRSMKQLIEICISFDERNIHLKSLRENIDTANPIGKLFFHIIAALAEFEKDIIRDRTRAGLEAAKARGKTGGRQRKMDDKQQAIAKTLLHNPATTIQEVCKMLSVSRATLYRYVKVKDGRKKAYANPVEILV